MAVTEPRLTKKGLATRERIVEAAAALMLERGVVGTTDAAVRHAANVSGSQVIHYFPDKQSLVAAVIEWRARSVGDLTVLSAEGGLDTLRGIRAWVDSYLSHEEACVAGCSFGSLAAEIMKSEKNLRAQLAAGFDQWEGLFEAGFAAIQQRGELRGDARPDVLTHVLMAAFQGGMLLAQAAGDSTPLRDSLNGAMDYIESFCA